MVKPPASLPVNRARRSLITGGTSGLVLAVGAGLARAGEGAEHEVPATEDLMREHGVLRRVILALSQSAPRLRADPGRMDAKALNDAARLFRSFGEDYHEEKLEEAHVFPALRQAGGPAAELVDTLKAQHDRGRDIVSYILAATAKGSIATADAEPLARAMENLDRMYANHTAREETIVFPAWRNTLSGHEFHRMTERFEELEHQMFGHDGFADAVERIGKIEQALGFADLAQFTAPEPPKA